MTKKTIYHADLPFRSFTVFFIGKCCKYVLVPCRWAGILCMCVYDLKGGIIFLGGNMADCSITSHASLREAEEAIMCIWRQKDRLASVFSPLSSYLSYVHLTCWQMYTLFKADALSKKWICDFMHDLQTVSLDWCSWSRFGNKHKGRKCLQYLIIRRNI